MTGENVFGTAKMLHHYGKYLVSIVLSFLLVSCQNDHTQNQSHIRVSDLNNFLIDSSPGRIWKLSDCDCREPTDTIYRNLPYSYQDGIVEIKRQFRKIDSLQYDNPTKEYAKALVVADFVYAAFSFQFLGTDYGLAKDSILVNAWKQWDTLPLNVCYDLGNSNQVSVYCSQRTSFFLRLMDTLMHVKGFSVTIKKGVHVFPVIKIAGGNYIVDPFDPAVFCDSTFSNVVDYETLVQNRLDGNFKPKRTRRLYGNSRQLFSQAYLNMLRDNYPYKDKDCFCCVLKNYLTVNEAKLMATLRPCYEMPVKPEFSNTHFVHNDRNIYCIGMAGRVDGPFNAHIDIMRYYVGIDSCGTR